MRGAVNNHVLPIYKENRIASLLYIFESTIPGESNVNTDMACSGVSQSFF